MKKNLKILIIGILLISTIFLLTGCGNSTNINKSNTSNEENQENLVNENNSINETETQGSSTTLSASELQSFEDAFNQTEDNENRVNGFLLSQYSNPSEIDLSKVFYDISLGEISDAEKEDLQKNYNIEEYTDVIKLPVSKIKSFYKENVGEDISDNEIKTRLTDYYTYIEKYDAYYAELGDTMYRKVKCVSGEKSSDGTYKIIYDFDDGSNWQQDDAAKECQVTLKQQGENYVFVSNVKIK